jgi:hypothetical protein
MKPVLRTFFPGITKAFLMAVFGFTVAFAHTTNEASLFSDIESSESRFDIVALTAIGIIPQTARFEPDQPMSRKNLAIWSALLNNLGPGGEAPDTEALANAALAQGLLESFAGNATYAEINTIFFEGQLLVEQPEATPTKAQAASYIASMLATPAGESLLVKRGLEAGPVGEVLGVESRMNPDGGSTYYLAIGDLVLPMYAHGRVANGPTDLLQWRGRDVRRSFIRKQGDFRLWVYLEATEIQAAEPQKPAHDHTQHIH